MKGAAIICYLTIVFVTEAQRLCKPNVPKSIEEWTVHSPVNAEELGEHFEGDMILPLPGLDRSGLVQEKYRWPGGIVPYKIQDGFTKDELHMLHHAFREYDKKTKSCIRFIRRTNETDYIVFTKLFGECSSSVGRRGGKQKLRLDKRCFYKRGTILHEMLHALGFVHEQSRTDRDKYVTILWQNIARHSRNNFLKYPRSVVTSFGISYDYGSIMHYSQYALSHNGRKTIIPKDPNAKIGQRIKFSEKDLKKLMRMYKCGKKN